MKVMSKKGLLAASAAMVALSPAAANAATQAVSVDAEILTPIAFAATQALDFGQLTESAIGTATVDVGGGMVVGGAVTAIGGHAAGGFNLTHAGGQTLVVSAAANTLTIASGGDTMNVTSIVANIDGGAAGDIAIGAGGVTDAQTALDVASVVRIGGVLNVGAGQAPGTYTNSMTVTVVYQ